MSLPVSKRVQRVKPSPTVALTGRVAQLKAEGKDIIGLGAGEPDFDTPVHIADAGVEAIRKGHTRYTAVEGTAELKDAIIAKFKRENGLDYKRNQILVSTGASQFEEPAGAISAAAIIITIPVVLAVLLFQRQIVAGLTQGAVKG